MIDDLPVGGGAGSGAQPQDEMEDGGPKQIATADHSAPIEQRLQSKNWQVRARAYEDLADSFKSATSQSDEVFREHASGFKKYLGDNNPGSLEKCLDTLQVFIDRCEPKIV
jgi:hypothetical protein